MDGAKKMPDLMSSHHNPGVRSTVLDQRNTADLGQAGVSNAGPTDIGIACCGPAHSSSFPSCHVQTGQGYHHVIDWQGRPGQELIITFEKL